MILYRISVKRHNTVRCNEPNSNTLTELLTLFTYRTIDPFHLTIRAIIGNYYQIPSCRRNAIRIPDKMKERW